MKDLLPKAAFVLSVGVLGFAYGFATEAWNLFPRSYVERAWRQARSLNASSSKHFLHDRVYDRSGTRTVDAERTQPGLTLLTSWWKQEDEWTMQTRLIDREGTVHHRWTLDGDSLFADARRMQPYIHGTHLFSDGDLMLNVEYGGTVRLDACGDIQWQLPERGHHSIERDSEGHFWIPGLGSERRRGSERYPDGYPGLDLVWIEPIMNVSAEGEVLDKINVLDVLYENGLQRHFVKTGSYRGDVTHMNDAEPLSPSMAGEYPLFEAGDLLVSLRNIDLVFVVDPETREVKWSTSDPFHSQHDPDFVGNGWIGVFDNARDFNGGEMLGGSRIVGLRPHTGEEEVWFPTETSERFYTPAGGKWQQLENGNMLLVEARAGRVVEVDSTGRTVWEWVKDAEGRSQVAEVLGGTRHDLTPEEVDAWSCASGTVAEASKSHNSK
jgi:hypothetical protein